MEHPHSLLMLVINQHYNNRPQILETLKNITQEYSESKTTYEQTLSNLYQLMNDLPADIVLYYLSTVPLPENQEVKSNSVLPGLMKQMLIPSYHNGMRPILLKYLNEQVPPLNPILNETNKNSEIVDNILSSSSQFPEENKENVVSVIDENIKQDKIKNKKGPKSKAKSNNIPKTGNIKPLALLCANNIYKNYRAYFSKYKKQRKSAWKLVNSNKCDKNEITICYNVIKDINKKIKWLRMFNTGQVPLEIIKEEYGKSDVFYLERHLQNSVDEDVLNLDEGMLNSIDIFLNKC